MLIDRAARLFGTALALILLTIGLIVTGPAPQAVAAVQTCSSATSVGSRPTLRRGDTGSCVVTLQRLLIAQGYSIGSADGVFGSRTDLGVRRYQSTKLDLVIDGIVGPATWNRLVNGGGTTYSLYSGPNTGSRVILSFDDCPSSLSAFNAAIAGARDLGIALVLSPTGDCLSTGRFSVAGARANGHYVINHSISHPDFTALSLSSIVSQLGSPGVATSYGRPPYGAYNETVRNAYATKGMRLWLWNVDTRDWTGLSSSQVVSYVIANARPGDTVLMHMGWNAFNKTSLSQIKSGLGALGLGVCRNSYGTTPSAPRTLAC